MKISKHITYAEAIHSNTAKRKGIDNTPNPTQLENMKVTAEKVFEPLRAWVGGPIKVNSFFRSPELNTAIGGSKTSQHLLGKAADITIQSLKPIEVFAIIEDLIDFGVMLQGGLGLYDTFVHYDIRKTRARWDYSNK